MSEAPERQYAWSDETFLSQGTECAVRVYRPTGDQGLVPVIVDKATLEWLMANPGAEVTVDLTTSTLQLPDGRGVPFPIEPFARYCLMQGVDQLGYLLSKDAEISAFEARQAARGY